MALPATRAIGTGDGCDITDSGIYVPDWAALEDVRPGQVIENPQRQPLGIDLFGLRRLDWQVCSLSLGLSTSNRRPLPRRAWRPPVAARPALDRG